MSVAAAAAVTVAVVSLFNPPSAEVMGMVPAAVALVVGAMTVVVVDW